MAQRNQRLPGIPLKQKPVKFAVPASPETLSLIHISTRHAAEFWMIEPEMAFADLNDNMEVAEDMLKYVIRLSLIHI